MSRTPPLLYKYLQKTKPKYTSVYRRWSYPLCDYKPNQMFWTSEPGPIMDDITFYRNMLNLVWFFDNRLWREVVVSIWCLALMCRSFLTTKESVSPPPTCHWGTRSFASQRSLAFSSPPGHKLHRPGKNQVDQFEAGVWPYRRQLNVTFWMKDLVLSYPDKISPSIKKIYTKCYRDSKISQD